MKAFCELEPAQVSDLIRVLEEAAVKWAEMHNIGALSRVGEFSVYVAIQDSIDAEWVKARKIAK